jgi:cytochrome P450 family 4
MLDTLLAVEADSGEINNQGICEEVDTFTFEGHDTTSTALTFTALLIGTHQDVQDKIVQEIYEIMGTFSFLTVVVRHFLFEIICFFFCLR